MMHNKPNSRIKLPQIKNHPWFALYKVSFEEPAPDTKNTPNNLITDSMIIEGEDPFDDFMNKRHNYSNSSEGKDKDNSKMNSQNTGDFASVHEVDQISPTANFKKHDSIFTSVSIEMRKDDLVGLEVILEECRVNK